MNPLSSFLFARPTFLGGMASVLDIGGTLQQYNTALTPDQADALALASDWAAVGGDLRHAIRQYIFARIAELESQDVGPTTDRSDRDYSGGDPLRRAVSEVVG